MLILFSVVSILALATFFYMRQPKFGQAPSGERLELIKKSPNYRDGKFQNINFTPDLSEGYSMLGILYDQLFGKHPRRNPVDLIPSIKTDLKNIPEDSDVLVWFGHSSYFMQIDGVRFLVDPVFSGNASPIPGTVKSFKGTDIYTVDDLPPIDYLIISHDHYDHVDHQTITALKEKTGSVICGLGVGAHFEHWGFSPENIIEKDWNESVSLSSGFTIHTTPARHFSGRGFTRQNTLWMSYVLESPTLKVYIGGDSGYGTHFADIGEKFGPIDLALLDNGQYNMAWKEIHMMPDEVLKAAHDLKAKRLFPVHSSKYVLAMHPWDEPLKEVTRLNQENPIPLVTPIIGECVDLNDTTKVFEKWWENVN